MTASPLAPGIEPDPEVNLLTHSADSDSLDPSSLPL
jgi:hypothetical protein